jgi:hypothetical protein
MVQDVVVQLKLPRKTRSVCAAATSDRWRALRAACATFASGSTNARVVGKIFAGRRLAARCLNMDGSACCQSCACRLWAPVSNAPSLLLRADDSACAAMCTDASLSLFFSNPHTDEHSLMQARLLVVGMTSKHASFGHQETAWILPSRSDI